MDDEKYKRERERARDPPIKKYTLGCSERPKRVSEREREQLKRNEHTHTRRERVSRIKLKQTRTNRNGSHEYSNNGFREETHAGWEERERIFRSESERQQKSFVIIFS
jgi:hypothetical protein